MNLISLSIVTLCYLYFLTACVGVQNEKIPSSTSNTVDALKIGYSDTSLIGKKLFPVTTDSNKLKNLLNEKVLLSFESYNYYYNFYNKKNKLDILSKKYWNQLMPQYVDFSVDDGLLSYSRFNKVNYYDPFLTGFYNSKDSIIISGFDLGIKDLQNKDRFQVNYFSTYDTLFKLSNNILVGKSLDNVLFELQVPNSIKQKTEFNLVLMEATTQIDNAWYNSYPDYCSDYSVTVILSIKNNKLTRIQYLDLEYIDYIFKQKSVSTSDIHYH